MLSQADASNAENVKKNVPKTQFIRPADNMLLFREDASNAENAQKYVLSARRRKKKKDDFSGREFPSRFLYCLLKTGIFKGYYCERFLRP